MKTLTRKNRQADEPDSAQCSAAPWLLLTASVNPLGCAGAMFTPEQRLRQYLGAFSFFLRFFRRRPELLRGIILAENSDASPAPFQECEKQTLPTALQNRVELLFFPPDGFLPQKGKSYNEMRMIDMALTRSSLMHSDDLVLKLTGRYPLWSLSGDLADLATAAKKCDGPLQIGYWPWPRIRTRFNKGQLALVDTRRIAFRASAWIEHFGGAWRTADNSKGRYFESITHEIVTTNRSHTGWVHAFRRPPLVLAPPGHRKYIFGCTFPPFLGRIHSLFSYLYLRTISPFVGD